MFNVGGTVLELDYDGYKDVSYAGLSGNAKRAKALSDVVDYLGWERFYELHDGLLKEPKRPSLETFRRWVLFAGIQGYPAKAWYAHLFGCDEITLNEESQEEEEEDES